MLQARGTQQPGPVTELCRWLYRPVKAETKQGGGEGGQGQTHTQVHTHTHIHTRMHSGSNTHRHF